MTTDTSPLPRRLWPPPRRDPAALGFGVAYVLLGIAGMWPGAREGFTGSWFFPLFLVTMGAAGLLGVLLPRWLRARDQRAREARDD
ncbi:MAG TPA: hypothetical protein VFS67_35350 [Polyangiaceae bacterium]|nr:hypothetical protein [Polyangiaceae bacterium]